MNSAFKKVPAVDKCFAILKLIARLKKPLGISAIAKALGFNKSTVFNIVHTLCDLGVLEKVREGKFQFGTQLYVLGQSAGRGSELISTVHPYLERISRKTKLSAFLGIRSGLNAVIIDKVDTAFDIKIFSEIGMHMPLLAGAGGKALLAQMPDAEVEDILSLGKLEKFTPNACTNKKKYKAMIKQVGRDGIAIDMEEYIEGIRAVAVPLTVNKNGVQASIWAVGLKKQLKRSNLPRTAAYLQKVAKEIEIRLASG